MTKAEAKAAAKMKLKAFVAQLATGEGKSIVIAMLAIFMVKLYGLKVPRTAFEDTHVHAQMHSNEFLHRLLRIFSVQECRTNWNPFGAISCHLGPS